MLKVLHLFSNSKWTGPAEPALNLALALRERRVEVDFACASGPDLSRNKIVSNARKEGLEPLLQLRLDKHRHLLYNFLDARKLRALLRDRNYDLLHCHLNNDNRIALRAARGMPLPVIRSSYHGTGFDVTGQDLLLYNDFIIQPSQRALNHDHAVHGVPLAKMRVVPGAVDLKRFNPHRVLPANTQDNARGGFTIGIVARIQPHRHYHDLFHAFRRLVDVDPNVRLLVVGRGSNQQQVGWAPVRDLGLEQQVAFTGFVDGDDYVAVLKRLDVGVFLVPGTDGTCRAVREIMALGIPMVVADRGMLPEIITHEREGLVFDNTVSALHEALARLRDDTALRARLGQNAMAKARNDFSLAAQAERVEQIYHLVLGK